MIRTLLLAAALIPTLAAAHTPWTSPPPGAVSYGPDVEQYVAPCLPAGSGLHYGLLIVHGGAWIGEGTGLDVEACGLAAAAGLVGLDVHYRLAKPAGAAYWPTQMQDLEAAIAAVQNPYLPIAGHVVQTPKFCAMGFSAGGHLVGMLGAKGRLACVVTNSGPTDMIAIQNAPLQAKFGHYVLGDAPMPSSCAIPDHAWCVSSPVYVLQPSQTPWWLEYGQYDAVVPPQQTLELADALGSYAELHSYPGGHVFNSLPPGAATAIMNAEMQWVLGAYGVTP